MTKDQAPQGVEKPACGLSALNAGLGMRTAQQVYDSIIRSTPQIEIINTEFGEYRNAKDFNREIDRFPFEQRVWFICKPDSDLANNVMRIADEAMAASNVK